MAYFAKGPLSRARAAFHLDYDSTLDMNELVAFLDGVVLTTTVLDKKYKDGVPEIVSNLGPGSQSGGEAENVVETKSRKRKKMKPGKTGLYPTEDSFIRRWWSAHENDTEFGAPGVTLDSIAKDRIAHLRIRETQLQIIVILEALALQPLATSASGPDGELPSASLDEKSLENDASASRKSKKPRDLGAILDIHVDRLCIWQSVSVEDGQVSKMRQPTDPTGVSKDPSSTRESAADILREFCVEVIAPL